MLVCAHQMVSPVCCYPCQELVSLLALAWSMGVCIHCMGCSVCPIKYEAAVAGIMFVLFRHAGFKQLTGCRGGSCQSVLGHHWASRPGKSVNPEQHTCTTLRLTGKLQTAAF